MRQMEDIIYTHKIPFAAEFYGYELYNAGDLKGAHEAWAKAALHGEPASTDLLTDSLLGQYEEFQHLSFTNRPEAKVIVDCLRYAAEGEEENSIMYLASALVGDPDVPDELRALSKSTQRKPAAYLAHCRTTSVQNLQMSLSEPAADGRRSGLKDRIQFAVTREAFQLFKVLHHVLCIRAFDR